MSDEDPILIILQPVQQNALAGECEILLKLPSQPTADAARAWVNKNFFGVEWMGDWICMAAGVAELGGG